MGDVEFNVGVFVFRILDKLFIKYNVERTNENWNAVIKLWCDFDSINEKIQRRPNLQELIEMVICFKGYFGEYLKQREFDSALIQILED